MSRRLMNSTKLRARLGDVSPMTVWRYLQDTTLAFPRPITIRKRNFWDEDEVEAFIARREAANDNRAT
jgi:predicted DNA-binding transcriptional regulator AlpA